MKMRGNKEMTLCHNAHHYMLKGVNKKERKNMKMRVT